MSFSCQKGEFDRFFNRLDRPVEESRPDRQPDRVVDPTGFHLCFELLFIQVMKEVWLTKAKNLCMNKN